ncbi:putative quinol monooxygenase [Microbacterium stercoris]|uniref:ABM domain-containing protein n=1 Tax=Microbacterium stercoris TaxID=2820289 RepID=A0A939QMQ0_9MICO|nr:antibiotic biosynthesis monooxygenase [Microbacterium stercoris]MBO3662271.1 hypothetical protein [Microbacterium stercoris]
MSYGLFLTHRALPGKRDELIAAWKRHMPAAIDANDGHEAYVYTTVAGDPEALMVFQQYASREEAAAFLTTEPYLAYLAESEHLLAGPPTMVTATPVWSKNVG